MSKVVTDCLRIMRLTLGRRNENDPDSSDATLLSYLNDFIGLTMSDDVKLFEQFGTLEFSIDETNTTGVYTFNDVGASSDFTNISQEAFITLTDPASESTSWNMLTVCQDPSLFYQGWGINNEDILTAGYPTEMLYYGNQFVFRTIPDDTYTVKLFGYKVNPALGAEGDPAIPFDYWLRYVSYGAALNYARDYRFEDDKKGQIARDFSHERKLMLTRTHNQIKKVRGYPNF